MTNSAETRRETISCRVFLSQRRGTLVRTRCGSERVGRPSCVHRLMASMNDQTSTIAGLDPVLTTSELAGYLGVPVQTIHDLRHCHRGPRGFRVGRELRYRVSEIDAWLAHLEQADGGADLNDGGDR